MKTQTRKKDFKRNDTLENIVGNLLIAERQATKLKKAVVDEMTFIKFGTEEEKADSDSDRSTFAFVHEGKMYKIHIQVEKVKNESLV